MVNIIESPPTNILDPIPISSDLIWVLQANGADVVYTAGVNAVIEVTFPATPSIPANGTEFTLWGQLFTVDDALAYTGNSFKMVSSGVTSSGNFWGMIVSNWFFYQATVAAWDSTLRKVTITWKNCGEQAAFTGDAMEYAALTGAGLTVSVTNGTTPVYADNYKIVCRFLRFETFSLIGALGGLTFPEAFDVDKTCTGTNALLLNYMEVCKKTFYPLIPDLGANTFIDYPAFADDFQFWVNTGIASYFLIEYGDIWRESVTCKVKTGTTTRSSFAFVWNAYFSPEDIYGMRRYWPGHVSGLPEDQSNWRFLTNKPGYQKIAKDSFCWLWFVNFESATNLYARFECYDLNGDPLPIYDFELPNPSHKFQNFNASPLHIAINSAISVDDLSHYDVHLRASNGTTVRTEKTRFIIDRECCINGTDVYFVNQLGVIGTLLVEIDEKISVQTSTEVLVGRKRTASVSQSTAYGGRTQRNFRQYQEVTIKARDTFGEEQIRWFESFRISSHKWLKVKASDGTFQRQKFLVNSGDVRIYKSGGNVELVATGVLQDIEIQSPTDPV